MKICKIDGCNRKSKSRGWCYKHYTQWYRSGDPIPKNPYIKPPADKLCKIDRCTNSYRAKGFCNMHYKRWRAHDDPLFTKHTPKPDDGKCKVEGCDDDAQTKDMCTNHYAKDRYHNNIQHRLGVTIRNRINDAAILGRTKAGSAVRDLGCSIDFFKFHIENQFEDWMNWDNHGEWHLDHIVPLYWFDLSHLVSFKAAVHYTNYQPMKAIDNMTKNRWVDEYILDDMASQLEYETGGKDRPYEVDND